MFKRAMTRVPWLPWIVIGVAVQITGGTLAWRKRPHDGDYGPTGSRHVMVAWSIIGGIGFCVMLVGLVVLGVMVASKALAAAEVSKSRTSHRAAADRLTTAAHQPVSDVATDPAPFAPHDGDSDVVASVRRELRTGASRSVVRGIVRKAAREQRLNPGDHPLIEALIDRTGEPGEPGDEVRD